MTSVLVCFSEFGRRRISYPHFWAHFTKMRPPPPFNSRSIISARRAPLNSLNYTKPWNHSGESEDEIIFLKNRKYRVVGRPPHTSVSLSFTFIRVKHVINNRSKAKGIIGGHETPKKVNVVKLPFRTGTSNGRP